MKKILGKIVFPLLLFILIEIFFLTSTWENIENKALNQLFELRGGRPTFDDILIVTIDDDTFSSLDTNWPFPRDYYARVINNLEKAGAKLIIFDVLFTESSDAAKDSILTEVASSYNNIVFAGKLNKQVEQMFESSQIIKPIPSILEKNIPWGLVNITYDRDGFVRNYNLYQKHDDKMYFPLGIVALSHLNQTDSFGWESKIKVFPDRMLVNGYEIKKQTRNSLMINYYGGRGSFETVSFGNVIDDVEFEMPTFDIDAFEDEMNTGKFKDKIILIGSTSEELHDNFATPFFENGQLTPGVEIHANFLEMVLHNDYLYRVNYIYVLAIHLLLLLIVFFVNSLFKPQITFILNSILILSSMFVSYYLFEHKNIIFSVFEVPMILIFIYVVTLVIHYIRSAKERQMIKNAFQHYMDPELVNHLLQHPSNLKSGGSRENISVLFSDIRSFTTYTETHETKQTVAILKEYLTAMVNVIKRNGGTFDKFVGDEIMAIFGYPAKLENHALNACKAALEMRREVKRLHEEWKIRKVDPVEMGIGVNSGEALVGNLGSEYIYDYTAIGDTINLGARLEPLCKVYDTAQKIIISEFTVEMVKDFIEVNYLDDVKVKGKDISVKIYEVIGEK